MKKFFERFCVMIICGCIAAACNMHFEPVISVNDEVVEIPAEGGDYYFCVSYRKVPTKFEPGEASKAFQYRLMLGNNEAFSGIIKYEQELTDLWPADVEYPEDIPPYGYPVPFHVPQNMTGNARDVKVEVSIDRNYSEYDDYDWGEWQTVFTGVQDFQN